MVSGHATNVTVLGATGRGAGERWSVDPGDVDIWMGTLSKALASCGGYVAGRASAPVVPVIAGSSTRALLLADKMRRYAVNVQPIVHPAVDDNAARLRFFINATHTDEQLRTTVEHLRRATAT